MTRKQVDKVEAILTAIVGLAVIAFASFTPEEGEIAVQYISELGTWSLGGYTLFKSIIEFVKSQLSE